MNSDHEKPAQHRPVWTSNWHISLVSLVMSVGCGGRSQYDASCSAVMVGSGGACATGGASSIAGAAGDGTADASSVGGQASFCDLTLLSRTIRYFSIRDNLGSCSMSEDSADSGAFGPWGTVVLDEEGGIVSASGPAHDAVYILADERWPCYASATFYYWCSVPA